MTLATTPIEPVAKDDARLGLDAASFRSFYDEALPRIYGYFLRRTGGSPALAEDLTQDTFMAAVRELQGGRRPATPSAWIHGIARHKLIDHYRRTGRSERVQTAAEAVDPHAARFDDDRSERLAAALDRVPAAQRAALVLCHLDGFTVAEAARALGRSEKALESLLGRGRGSLRRAYLELAE
ncbi:MAG TPA: RNA polymerase sigma factor [Gaiellales bacterium]